MRPWSVGDNVNLAVGQGDVQASPLQMAVAYSAHRHGRARAQARTSASRSRTAAGASSSASSRRPARKIAIDPASRQAVLDGLHASASEPGGTSTSVWQGWNQAQFPVYGKTGTAETFDHGIPYDQSWYVCWVKDNDKPDDPGVVIAVTVEKGGFGAQSAAPAARLIASKFVRPEGPVHRRGDNKTR